MALWRDALLPASFRGIPFYIDDTDMAFGRRNETNEYPKRDEPYTEDLGRRARQYSFNAYVIGELNNVFAIALINAIESYDTAGLLIHPTLGIKQVIPTGDCRVSYSEREGGLHRFQLTFVEAGQNAFPSSLTDTISAVVGLVASSATTVINNFITDFTTDKSPHYVKTAATDTATKASGAIREATKTGVTNSDTYSVYMDSLDAFDTKVDTLLDAESLGNGLQPLVTGLTDIYTSPKDAYAAQKNLINFGASLLPVPTTTTNRKQQVKNQQAIVNLIQNTALIEMARSVSAMTFESRQEALAIRDDLDDLLTNAMTELADSLQDEQYDALSKVQAAMINDISARGSRLPDIITVKTGNSLPAAVFAYNQYGDTHKTEEVAKRNRIRNPLFLPPHTELEVLK